MSDHFVPTPEQALRAGSLLSSNHDQKVREMFGGGGTSTVLLGKGGGVSGAEGGPGGIGGPGLHDRAVYLGDMHAQDGGACTVRFEATTPEARVSMQELIAAFLKGDVSISKGVSTNAEKGVWECTRCGRDELDARESGCTRGPCPMEYIEDDPDDDWPSAWTAFLGCFFAGGLVMYWIMWALHG